MKVPIYVHTGIKLGHLKTQNYNEEYYNAYLKDGRLRRRNRGLVLRHDRQLRGDRVGLRPILLDGWLAGVAGSSPKEPAAARGGGSLVIVLPIDRQGQLVRVGAVVAKEDLVQRTVPAVGLTLHRHAVPADGEAGALPARRSGPCRRTTSLWSDPARGDR